MVRLHTATTVTAVGVAAAAMSMLAMPAAAQIPPGCGRNPPRSGTQTIDVEDPIAGRLQRSYQLYLPRNYDSFQGTAVVIDFHGYYDTGGIQEEESGIKTIADASNFIAVWPNGLDDTVWPGQDAYSWNSVGTASSPGPAGDTCKWPAEDSWNGYACHTSCRPSRGCRNANGFRANGCDCSTCADDLLFVEKLLEQLSQTLCVAEERIYLTGMSNGAMMVYALAQSKLASKFAAIAPVSGSPLVGFGTPPTVPMPIMELHGSKDNIIPANTSQSWRGEVGPDGSTVSSDGFYYEPVDRTLDRFALANSCGAGSTQFRTRFDGDTDLYCVARSGCTGGQVVRCSYSEGHTWPFGEGIQNRQKYALLIWEFFTVASKANGNATSSKTSEI